MPNDDRILYLCAGLQSSGSTLISWCFLQRRDMDGILDGNNDELAGLAQPAATPFVWLKTTISSFRLSEQVAHYEDLGRTVRPLLICRDVREVYASLRTKEYGRNGTTAEDPPLRLRLRRFREDWDLFHENDWPILRYDDFLRDPERTLKDACTRLGLPWDAAMLHWPKAHSEIGNTRHGNETFRRHCQGDLWRSLKPVQERRQPLESLLIPARELDWLEQEFARFNHVNSYPAHVDLLRLCDMECENTPSYEVTRRRKWKLQQTPLKYLLKRMSGWLQPVPQARSEEKPQRVGAAPCPQVPQEVAAASAEDQPGLGALASAGS